MVSNYEGGVPSFGSLGYSPENVDDAFGSGWECRPS